MKESFRVTVEPAEMEFNLDYKDRVIGKKVPKELIKAINPALEIRVERIAVGRIIHFKRWTTIVDVYRP